MKIGIVGGSGFIGTRLARRLLQNGYRVIIIDKEKSKVYPHLWKYGDVCNKDSLLPALEGIGVIYNLAAQHKDNIQPKNLYDEVNIKGAEVVCRACTDAGISKIIFTSSVAVYGFASPDTDEYGEFAPFNELWPHQAGSGESLSQLAGRIR